MTGILGMKDKLIEKIARYESIGTPQWQIAKALGLSEGRISQVQGSDEYGAKLQEITNASLEQRQDINRGYDVVEEEALANVLINLRNSPDPDYAIKAMVAANRANRQPSMNGQPLNGQVNGHAVIKLNQVYINKLQMLQAENVENAVQRPAIAVKKVDQLPISEINTIINPEVELAEQVADIFSD